VRRDLEELTDDTIKEIRSLEIVLPEIYKDVFYTKAKQKNIKLNIEDKEKALIYAMKKIQKIEHQAQHSTSVLKESIKHAKEAIEKKDTKKLENVQEQIQRLEEKINNLEEELLTDDLTTTYNRRWLSNSFLADEKFRNNGTFAFVDIDDFKEINDQYGHLTGDKVLKLLAKTLKRIEDSFIVRYAGDEFLVISTHKAPKSINDKLLAILHNLESTGLKSGDNVFTISFSYGITEFHQGDTIKDIIRKADNNMYDYKNSKQ
jgi:diguanylate cyclase